MIQCFLDSYIPDSVLYREKQEELIKATFDQYKQYGTGTNLCLLGCSGSGKTLLVKKLIRENDSCIYFSAETFKTSFKLLRALANTKSRDYSTFIDSIIERIEQDKKILIIDELNRLDDSEMIFDALNTIYRHTGIPIILISNNRKVFLDMPDDARQTLFLHKVEFPAYTYREMIGIITSRIALLPQNVAELLSEDTIKYISIVCDKEGSARDALDFTMKCILRNTFSREFIDTLTKEKRRLDWDEFAQSLTGKEKEFLNALLQLYREDIEITNSNLQTRLPQFCPQIISMLITDFCNKYGLIDIKEIKNQGLSGGRFRVIQINHDIFCKLEGLV